MNDNDSLFDALAVGGRRQLLFELLDADRIHVPALSERSRELAEADEALLREYLSSDRAIAGADKDRLRTHCVDLPKLVEHDYVKWDRNANVVTRGPRFDEVRPILELVDDRPSERPAPEPIALLQQ